MRLIKLTDKNGQTRGNTQWGEGVTHTVKWGGKFCAPGCIHVYDDVYKALFLNPIHGDFSPVRIWEAEGEILISDRGFKYGTSSLTIIKEIVPQPSVTLTQRVAFGILCALEVYLDKEYQIWADGWLNKNIRSKSAAAAADAAAVYAAAYDARDAAYAAYVADAADAADAARAAAYAAYVADAADAARAAVRAAVYAAAYDAYDARDAASAAVHAVHAADAADAARAAASAAVHAADAAHSNGKELNFKGIIEKAMNY